MEDDQLKHYRAAWRANKAPQTAREFDQLISLPLEASVPVFGLVTWNPKLHGYEVQPAVWANTKDRRFQPVQLDLEPRFYYRVKRFLRSLGLKHLVNIKPLRASQSPPAKAEKAPKADLEKLFALSSPNLS